MAIELVLAAPVTQRLLRDAQALRQLPRRAAGAQHLHRLAAELLRIRRSGLRHDGHHPFAPSGRKPSGVRKTGGTPVAFATAQQWIDRLEQAQHRNALDTKLRRLERYSLLIVDEIGYLPLERQAANLLFALVARRYERGSIIVTSNRGFEAWGEILGDAMVAAALIDRLVHHAHIITLKGKSYRLRERGAAAAPVTAIQPAGLRPTT